jgi:thiosulfate/3-mercaptopyruvate sulfurtransferase
VSDWSALNESPLIDVSTLAAMLPGMAPPAVLDVRFRLAGPPGRRDYLIGHIPGAVFLDVDDQLCGPPGPGGRHPLPEPAALQRDLRAAGVRRDHPVVVYDGGTGEAAARLWWTLRWAGHPAVRVLDGGYPAWAAAGKAVEPGEVSAAPGDFTVVPGALPVLDAAGAAATAAGGVLLDARARARYRGETEPIDRVAGHIPGAVSLPATELHGPDGRLLPVADLRARFARAGVRPGTAVGAYCGSGLTAADTVLALTAAGVADPALYVGSWSEWITDPDRPVATS